MDGCVRKKLSRAKQQKTPVPGSMSEFMFLRIVPRIEYDFVPYTGEYWYSVSAYATSYYLYNSTMS